MKNFVKNLLTITIFLTGFFVFFGAPVAEACEVLPSTNFRYPAGSVIDFDDDIDIFAYLDVQTTNCNQTPSLLSFRILSQARFGQPEGNNPATLYKDSRHIQNVSVLIHSGQTPPSNIPSSLYNFETNQSQFTIPIILGERGGGQLTSPNSMCGNSIYLSDNRKCILWFEVVSLNLSNLNSPPNVIYEKGGPPQNIDCPNGSNALAWDLCINNQAQYLLRYSCDGSCNKSFQIGCPAGAGQSPEGILPKPLPYGLPNICAANTSTTPITFPSGSSFTGGTPEEYSTEPLAPLPGFTGNPDFGQLLESWFTMLIVIAGILALIMIVVGGVTYITSESFGGKGQGKAYILNAVAGLVLALGAWIILNTINPNLADNLNISIPSVSIDGYEYSAPGVASIGSSCGPKNGVVCSDCQPIEGGIDLKPEVSTPPNNTIRSDMRAKLYNMQNSLSSSGINWRVTEAFTPTYLQHCSQCHYNGTCIDANFTGTSPTPQNIQTFVMAAAQAGLRAVYETNNPQTITEITQQTTLQPSTRSGSGNYLLLNGITAPHFSVYNQ